MGESKPVFIRQGHDGLHRQSDESYKKLLEPINEFIKFTG